MDGKEMEDIIWRESKNMAGFERTVKGMSTLERRITVGAVIVPFLGFVAAIVLLWGGLVTGRDLAILAVMYTLVGFGVTIGFHRLLTHRSFEAPTPVRVTLAILGSMSLQGAVIHWVADHRKHHTFTDEPGDPHSPHVHDGEGWRGVLGGWWHAHTGWLFDRQVTERASARRYARDLREDPAIRFVDRWFLGWVALGLALPFAAGFALSGGSIAAGATALLWGGLVRIFVLHHATWSVNSICHMYGTRPFETDDESRNNWVVALVSMGEGWHHNHHAFPTSARHGLRRVEIDPSYAVIKLMERLGLARNVKSPRPQDIERKLPSAAGAASPSPSPSPG
jgi:stearoyl-CoA desaturase (delta-9 desaturase)